MRPSSQTLLDLAVEKYLNSGDFNGFPVYLLADPKHTDDVRELVEAGLLDVVRGDFHPNPHIKALPAEDIDVQLSKLDKDGLAGCLYPTPRHLRTIVRPADYQRRPFTLAMARGMAQLEFWPFDIRAMEWYRNDPRFEIDANDISFSITIKDEFAATMASNDRDNISIDRGGFCYDRDDHRALAVFARDLGRKPQHHQMEWLPHVLDGGFKLQEDFFASSVLGAFSPGISVFDAFLEERKTLDDHLNQMVGRRLFKSAYASGDRPDRFGFIVRPTAREIADFHQVLDKVLSDDISKDFFEGLVETHEVLTDAKGRARKMPHGTIKMASEWVRKEFGSDTRAAAFLSMLKSARQRRQKPAHVISPDAYDHAYVDEQRAIMRDAYQAMKGFRDLVESQSGVPLVGQSRWLEDAVVRFK
ncbi:MAG: hypothetical protein Q7U72_11440 [Brevundimonas sp.]|uniref:hypothetical protein n=1 Tax=Brevundimonas sp. TaxID=1871086 RepID=UPI002721A114|nr:hypothetical protein [Brevundimonas sp.]MDO9078044.1 hypothetical protein [Brevundimonas sp.]MDP3079875.1 hypothetical protein [Brevundimonas sp.]MDZ4061073.1 hypothetical protein [Brevundimonas sp.]